MSNCCILVGHCRLHHRTCWLSVPSKPWVCAEVMRSMVSFMVKQASEACCPGGPTAAAGCFPPGTQEVGLQTRLIPMVNSVMSWPGLIITKPHHRLLTGSRPRYRRQILMIRQWGQQLVLIGFRAWPRIPLGIFIIPDNIIIVKQSFCSKGLLLTLDGRKRSRWHFHMRLIRRRRRGTVLFHLCLLTGWRWLQAVTLNPWHSLNSSLLQTYHSVHYWRLQGKLVGH